MEKKVAEYIENLPDSRRDKARALHELIMQLFPNARIDMQYRMPTYHWRNNFLAWGNKKNYLSVYTCSRERIAEFKLKHPNIPAGVGCLNFRDKDEFPLHSLNKVIHNALSPSKVIQDKERIVVNASGKRRNKQ
ncbi:DUF1801 domain-containing protein [Kaarinaea lacus]